MSVFFYGEKRRHQIKKGVDHASEKRVRSPVNGQTYQERGNLTKGNKGMFEGGRKKRQVGDPQLESQTNN